MTFVELKNGNLININKIYIIRYADDNDYYIEIDGSREYLDSEEKDMILKASYAK